MLVLAELELWPNLIRAAKSRGAKVAVINGRLGEKSFRGYRRIRPLVAGLMRQIDLLAVQDETYAERFRAMGARPETVHVTGSMKYDGAKRIETTQPRGGWLPWPALRRMTSCCWPAVRKSRKRLWHWRRSAR